MRRALIALTTPRVTSGDTSSDSTRIRRGSIPEDVSLSRGPHAVLRAQTPKFSPASLDPLGVSGFVGTKKVAAP
jgi:hypothetical protein